MEGKQKKIAKKIILYLVLAFLSLIWVVPMFTLVATAVKSKQDFMSGISLFAMPEQIAWSNFYNAMVKGRLFAYMKNDFKIGRAHV